MAAEIVFGRVDAYGFKRTADEVRIIRELLDEDINRFVTDSNVDASAANELKLEVPEIQWAVLQRGPVRSASNPSAALVGRIRDAKRMKLNGGTTSSAPFSTTAASVDDLQVAEVDKFIMENRLDPTAARSLKSEHMDVQKTVMAQGPLLKCYNPSGALMGRIRAARLGQRAHTAPTAASPGTEISNISVDEEARKAIEQLTNGRSPEPTAQTDAAPTAVKAALGDAPTFGRIEDLVLHDQAMKAVQNFNSSSTKLPQADIIY